MVGKLEKLLQNTKDLQKRIDFITEKLASAGESVNKPIESRIKGKASKKCIHKVTMIVS